MLGARNQFYPSNTRDFNEYSERRLPATRRTEEGNHDMTDDGSMIGSILGAIFCFLLFLLIVFSVCYPFTMYKTNPNYTTYSDEKWWCYHCTESWCANKCWYSNGL